MVYLSHFEGKRTRNPLKQEINKVGFSLTDLAPLGFININGRSFEALSNQAKIPAGCRVRAIGVNLGQLVVELHEKQ